jgi:hypothetical protein
MGCSWRHTIHIYVFPTDLKRKAACNANDCCLRGDIVGYPGRTLVG